MTPKTKKHANRVDVHVGRRLRIRRVIQGMSQTALAEQLGLTFQQLQKYESGANRVSASRLWQIAQILDVPVQWFFMGLDNEADDDVGPEPLSTKRETLELVRNVQACPPDVQKRLRALLHAIADASKAQQFASAAE